MSNLRFLPDAAQRRLVGALTVLALLAIGAVVLYGLSLIVVAMVLLLLSALLAYLIFPLVTWLERRLARSLAVAVAYLLVAGAVAACLLLVGMSLLPQIASLRQDVQFLASPAGQHWLQSWLGVLASFGVSQNQIGLWKNQALSWLQGELSQLLPFLSGVLSNVLECIVVITLSVYFVLDGPRIISWIPDNTPVKYHDSMSFLLQTLDHSLGGYFRGSLLIASFGAVCTGVFLALLHVPYAVLLGFLFFLLYFVPVIGAYIIGPLCLLAALSQGWYVTLAVAVFLVLLQQVVMGQILSPRVFSKTVGVHPIVGIFALFAGAELFGLLGGILAVPVAGVLQQVTAAVWRRWKQRHRDQFPPEEASLHKQ